MRVVIAPDSFKGTCTATDAARAIAEGWRSVRPDDDIVTIPLADGGEGTLDALETVRGAERRSAQVTGPQGDPVTADWLWLPTGEAVIELAQAAGLPLMNPRDSLHATTRGVGELMRTALEAGATSITVALGGSATTDGGAGALAALGLHLFDDSALPLPDGGGALRRLAWIDDQDLLPPPEGGVQLLTDVTNPLLGAAGAAAVFGPQKGAAPHQVDELEAGLARLAEVLGADPAVPGMGAAGGAAYGLSALWGATTVPGAAEVGRLSGLREALEGADVVITGEGRFDGTSLGGKVVGHVLDISGARIIVIAGIFAEECSTESISLESLAGSPEAAQSDAAHWLRAAGAEAAAC
ncbi:MAG: glycerate kinase [Propionibacteriaceae bacterium]|nr:glycerate kinase [Propionibacteriaceae bacterium]